MKVYRLERDGLGPFTQYTNNPTPFVVTCEDVQYKQGDVKHHFLYGTDDKEKLNEYFGDQVLQELLNVGFQIKEYDVPKRSIRFSPNKKQIAFKPEDIEEIVERFLLVPDYVPHTYNT